MDQPMQSSPKTQTSPYEIQDQMSQQPPLLPDRMQQNQDQEVLAVRKNGDGDIVELQLSSGQIVDYKMAQTMVKNKQIRNLNVFRGRDGEEHLRSNADGDPSNNLDHLPTF